MRSSRLVYTLGAVYGLIMFIGCSGLKLAFSGEAFSFGKIGSSITLDALFSGALGLQVIYFLFIQLSLHIGFGICVSFVSDFLSRVLLRFTRSEILIFHLLFFISVLWIFLENTRSFPASAHSLSAYRGMLTSAPGGWIMAAFFYTATLLALISLAVRSVRFLPPAFTINRAKFWLFPIASIAFLGYAQQSDPLPQENHERPHIILVGVDSLRPDHVGYFGYPKDTTPNLDRFLADSVVYTDALTPLARTFPSYISLLTGRYPREHGARYNLIDREKTADVKTLAHVLSESGYDTAYATDEKRFSNIDEYFGFSSILGPEMGAADFLFGAFNDFPLTNLVSNTRLGKWLFPFTYANRAAEITYRPETFSREIERFLDERSRRPLFLVTHFCLPHWPYAWAGHRREDFIPDNPQSMTAYLEAPYDGCVKRADLQVQQLLDALARRGYLQNAVVVLFSDHGESFGFSAGDFLLREEKFIGSEMPVVKKRLWHGTSAFSYSQNHVLLAIKDYRRPAWSGRVHERVSLVDVAPTLLDLSNLTPEPTMTGQILPKPGEKYGEKPVFVETGFYLEALSGNSISMGEIIKEGARYYRVDQKTGRLVVRNEFFDEIIDSKEKAVFFGNHGLGYLPNLRKFVYVDLDSEEWEVMEYRPDGGVKLMLYESLVGYFGSELPRGFSNLDRNM